MPSDYARPAGTSGLGPGTVLDGKYEILKRIGAGGMGEVFKARHLHLDAFRCIKVMKQALLADDVYRVRFLREARLATQVHHPNIAVVHDFFVGDGGNYMVTEFIDGTTLRQWSATHGPFPIALASDVASQVLSGLDHIHRRGLLHRDISPDNVMLSFEADGRLEAKIIDLGIAKDVNTAAADRTMAGVLIGNPKYMSPEQLGLIGEDEQIDGRTDLYSLGVVLYEMLLGVPPFASETPHGYIMKHLTEAPTKFAVARPGVKVSHRIEEVVFRSLEKNRDRRFKDAREFASALEPFLIAPVGTLTNEDVTRLRNRPSQTLSQQVPLPIPTLGPEDATIAEPSPAAVKETALERTGVEDMTAREQRQKDEDEEFQRAWEDGRASTWRAFITTHPESPHAARAQLHLDEAVAFEKASVAASETAVRQFLTVWPDGRHNLEAEILLVDLRQRVVDAAFTAAKTAGTYAAMRDFLARFGTSAFAEEARRIALERLAFDNALAAGSSEAWDAFLETWAEGERTAEARALRERAREHEEGLAFDGARHGGRAALQDFMRLYPDSVHVKEAKRLLRQLAESEDFAHARSVGTPAAWRLYLTSYPAGAHAAEARTLLQTLEERLAATEPQDFSAAWESGTSDAWNHFLAEHGESARIEEARLCRQEAADFELAVQTNTPAMWRAFLKTWPEGRHRLDAAFRLRSMRER